MKNINIIAAIGQNNELGINNHLIFNLKEDMKFFRETTINKTIVMGRKTFESLPGLLPKRKNIVLSKNNDLKIEGLIVMNSIENVIEYAKQTEEEIFIIGGASIYKLFLPYAQKIYLTEVEKKAQSDVYFPSFNKENYTKTILKIINENGVKARITLYDKK